MNVRALVASTLVASALFAAGTAGATPISGPHSVSAFYSNDDGYLHAMVAQTNGNLDEVYWTAGGTPHVDTVAQFSTPITAVGSFYSPLDALRHAVVALENGQIWEVYFNPRVGISKALIYTWDPTYYTAPTSLTAWVDADGVGWYSVLLSQKLSNGTTWQNADVACLQNHQTTGWGPDGAEGFSDWTLLDVSGTAFPYQSGPGALKRNAFTAFYPGNDGTTFYAAEGSWTLGGQDTPLGGDIYPIADLPISFADFPNWLGYTVYLDSVALDAQNRLLEMPLDINLSPVVAWTFVYGPKAMSLGVAIDPVNGVKHVPVMMSNGDLWDMNSSTYYGRPWSFQKLGVF